MIMKVAILQHLLTNLLTCCLLVAEVKVSFAPENNGYHAHDCYILCDDCTYFPISFTGIGSAPMISVSAIDSVPFVSKGLQQPLPAELDFGVLSVTNSSSKTITLTNCGEMEVAVNWLLFLAPDAVAQCSGLPGTLTPQSCFTVCSYYLLSLWIPRDHSGPACCRGSRNIRHCLYY